METVSHDKTVGGKIVSKKDVISQIKKSEKELRMLGTVAFSLPWNDADFVDHIFSNYLENDSAYEITIVAESDLILHSYALTSRLNKQGVGIPIATLEEIRENSTSRLRKRLISTGAKATEPPEDQYRQKLDALYAKCFVGNICKELHLRGISYDIIFGNRDGIVPDANSNICILGLIKKCCIYLAKTAFQRSNIAQRYFSTGDFFNLGKANAELLHDIENTLKDKFALIEDANQDQKIEALFEFCINDIELCYENSSKVANDKEPLFIFSISARELRAICADSALKVLEFLEPNHFELIREYASKAAYKERSDYLLMLSSSSTTKQRLFIKQIYHSIPVQMLMIDGIYFAAVSPLLQYEESDFLYIGNSSLNQEEDPDRFYKFDEFVQYFNQYINSSYCTEETKKRNRMEVVYNYTSDHAVLGPMPRDSFYGSDNYKLVMWALVFDRKGRILIHRRANNAKDNQGLWDKSVGGHIASTDRDTIHGAAREIAEELFQVEEEEQSHTRYTSFSTIKSDEIIYLGKWKDTRYPNFVNSLKLESGEFYLFSFESSMTERPIDSMRILPDGTRIKARCFVDLYFTIASKDFNLNELKNSKYLLLPPQLIKQCAKSKYLSREMRQKIEQHNPNINLDDISDLFEVTPDLEYIINCPEWDYEITKFSIRVKEAFAQ